MADPVDLLFERRSLFVESTQPSALIIADQGLPGPKGDPGEPGLSYRQTFTDSDLSVAGLLPVAHNLGAIPHSVSVLDGDGEQILCPVSATETTVILSLSPFRPLNGQWQVSIGA